MFLTILASIKCCSKVHNFSGFPSVVIFPGSLDQIMLVELPGFLAKNQLLSDSCPLVMILALTAYKITVDLDHCLCPVRTESFFVVCLFSIGPDIICLWLWTFQPQEDQHGLHYQADLLLVLGYLCFSWGYRVAWGCSVCPCDECFCLILTSF